MATTVLWKTEEYKADLSECLAGIDSSSKRLIEEANLTFIRVTQAVHLKTSEGGSWHTFAAKTFSNRCPPGLEMLKKIQLGQLKMWKEQKRLADKQTEIAATGRKLASRQGKLATGLSREAAANE